MKYKLDYIEKTTWRDYSEQYATHEELYDRLETLRRIHNHYDGTPSNKYVNVRVTEYDPVNPKSVLKESEVKF